MPAAITLSSLTFALPDGRVLFSDLNFSFNQERIGLIGRNGIGKSSLLALIAGAQRPTSGAIRVSGTLGTLHQSFAPEPGETLASLFGVGAALERLARIEAGAGTETDFDDADWTLEARLAEALARAGLADVSLSTSLATLSGGQRTRASLAALIFAEPDFLLLDEPTNNLDREGRAAVARLLSTWRGGAVVVSHDRELLENMDAIVELTSLGAARYGGGWSSYEAQKALELAAAEQDLAQAQRRVEEAGEKAQAASERKARRDGAGSRQAAKGGAPRILLGTLKGRAEESSGALNRLAEKQKAEAEEAAATARTKLEVLQPFIVRIPPSRLPAGKAVLTAAQLCAGYDPEAPLLRDLSFELRGPERVAIVGPNGSGKSTLLATLTGALPPLAGEAQIQVPSVMLDQEVSILEGAHTILENFQRLNPEADENACRAALARFRFRADAALQVVSTLSGGERLRAGLACVLGGGTPPQLLILDEPTNHLDIASLETVEAGLNAYDGALLIVSHDEAFLGRIGITRRISLR
ncbi:ABC transporter, ATP-binding protein [Hyphomonas neptunium ATCC 15444]|uniref:ABC transporter, ATP-binding protein n=2 Tax=Hyphomonas TaxID=85 RepID=Q0C3L6_HYPNA|nr:MULTISPECIES: ABC-F family ATP-binding cassette domain-containing protein [Hyphomonas]ABI78444.1 ABC transporter, ATP-binding protein [Hyphomonas neptunium ATCC 15444]KCZ96112.1 ABC transporter ATP-binding protein [Hyphomonas hirschiana VP5]